MVTPQYRLFGCFRFGLALAVVLSHSLALSGDPAGGVVLFLGEVGLGNPAVMGFFVLSGYIITEASVTFYRNRPAAFLANRFWRIAPPYWAALAVSVVIHIALTQAGVFKLPDAGTPTAGMFSFSNLAQNGLAIFPRPRLLQIDVPEGFYGFVRFYWAILVEFIFYLAVFLVMVAGAVMGRARQFAIAAATAALMCHVFNDYWFALRLRTELGFVPYFVLGVSLYALSERWSAVAATGAAVSYALVILGFSRYVQGKIPLSAEWAHGLLKPANATAIVLMALVPFGIVLLGRVNREGRLRRIDRVLGDLTYPVYLNHFVVLVLAVSLMEPSLWVVPVVIVSSIVLSQIMKALVESPMKPLRDRLRGTKLLTAEEAGLARHETESSEPLAPVTTAR